LTSDLKHCIALTKGTDQDICREEESETAREQLKLQLKEAQEQAGSHTQALGAMEAERRLLLGKRAIKHMLKYHLAQAWNQFVECTQHMMHTRDIVRKVVAKLTHRQLAGAFDCYASAVETIVDQRERVQKVMARWRTPEVKRALECWFEYMVFCVCVYGVVCVCVCVWCECFVCRCV